MTGSSGRLSDGQRGLSGGCGNKCTVAQLSQWHNGLMHQPWLMLLHCRGALCTGTSGRYRMLHRCGGRLLASAAAARAVWLGCSSPNEAAEWCALARCVGARIRAVVPFGWQIRVVRAIDQSTVRAQVEHIPTLCAAVSISHSLAALTFTCSTKRYCNLL